MDELRRLNGVIKKNIEVDKAQAIIFEIKLEDLTFTSLEYD